MRGESFKGPGAGLQIVESLVPLGGPGSLAKVWQHERLGTKFPLDQAFFHAESRSTIFSQHYWVGR